MSVVTGKRIIGVSTFIALIVLLPALAQASATTVTICAPIETTAGTTCPIYVLVLVDGIPADGASVTASVSAPGSIVPATASTNSSGYASFSLTAPTSTGVMTITAECNGVNAVQDVQVVPDAPADLQILTPPGLLPADGYNTYTLIARATDQYGNGCYGWPINVTVDGVLVQAIADAGGNACLIIGPSDVKHTYDMTAEANGLSESVQVRFFAVNLYLLSYPSSVPAGQNVTITALLLDDLTPAPGIELTFTVYSPDSLATPSLFSGYTDAGGQVDFTFKTSPKAGMNTVIISNLSLGGDLRYASVRGAGGNVGQLVLATTPGSPVYADGVTSYLLRIWAKDSGGNPVKSEELTVVRNYFENYTVVTNSNGYAEIEVGPSPYVGDVHFDVIAMNGITNGINLSYIAGPPTRTVIRAVPNVIASSDVPQPPDMVDVHSTDIIAQVTDEWYHPLPGYSIDVSSLNTTAGTITGSPNGTTDTNGEFYTVFSLGGLSNGTGTVDVQAVSGTLSSVYSITYTNYSFLSVDTSITPRNVTVNGTMNVTVTIKGLGWNNRPQPIDMMLITDRSGSMDWYSTIVSPAGGAPLTGTLPQANKEYLIATYDNTQYGALQFMLSSPYTNYSNGSYYSNLKVTAPNGQNYSGTRYSNENTMQFSTAKLGTYKVYARFVYDVDGGTPPYSYCVLTRPPRLGSSSELNTAAKVAARQLADNMTFLDQMGLVSFSTSSTLNAQFKVVNGTNKTNLVNAINGLGASGGTEIFEGILRARQEFAARGRSTAKHVCILLSDGYSQSPGNDIVQANLAKNDGILIFTIGMGMADFETLGRIANITGGQFYRVASDLELSERYQQIFRNVSNVVATSSSMSIASDRSIVNGTLTNDTQYVPHTAIVTFTNGTTAHVEPIVTIDAWNYTLSWEPGIININDIWSVRYTLIAMHGGIITPISANSSIVYTRSDGSSGVVNFASDTLFCQDSMGGQVNATSSALAVDIQIPSNSTVITQLRTIILWQVTYNASDQYTQYISVIPENGGNAVDIARGFPGDRDSLGTYSHWWNLERMPTGNYTIRVFASDGTYDAWDEVHIQIPYNSGEIVLQ